MYVIGELLQKAESEYFRVVIRGVINEGSSYASGHIIIKKEESARLISLLKCLDWYFEQPLNDRRKGAVDLTEAPDIDKVFMDPMEWRDIWYYEEIQGNPFEISSYSIYYYDLYGDKYAVERTG